jgi:hypothetical protein
MYFFLHRLNVTFTTEFADHVYAARRHLGADAAGIAGGPGHQPRKSLT